MKYWLMQFVVLVPLILLGHWLRYTDGPWFALGFGVILAVYGATYCYFDYKRREARDQKEYDKWVSEMNDSINYPDWP